MNIQSKLLYLVLISFFVFAFGFQEIPKTKLIDLQIVIIKYILLIILILFVGYTIHCTIKENFYISMKKIFKLLWGRQVGIDLYIGLLLFSFFVFMIEKSVGILLLWLVPSLIFGNIIPLTYLVTHFELVCNLFGY